jgi:DME family drug/metabolite transporter
MFSSLHTRLSTKFSAVGRSSFGQSVAARIGLLQISIAAMLWGLTGVVVRFVHDDTGLSAISIGFYRLAFAALAMLVISAPRLPGLVKAVRAHPVSIGIAGVGLAVYQALYFVSVTTAGVTVATVVSLGVAPIALVGWEAVHLRRRPSLPSMLIVIASLVGLGLIASANSATAATPAPVLGLFAAIGSGICYAATTVVSTAAARSTSLLAFTTATTTIGALVMIPAAAVAGFGLPLGPVSLGQLAFLGVVTTALAYGFFYAGLRSTTSSVAAVLTLLEPLTAAVLAVLLLAEPIYLSTLVGGVLLLAAVAALYLIPQPKASATGDPAAVDPIGPSQDAISSPR